MKKLKLEDLAPYLPYGLRINNKGIGSYILTVGSLERVLEITETFKPILRPLSDLTQEELIEELGTHISHLDYVTYERKHYIKHYSHKYWLDDIPYAIYEYLIKNHFDVFVLIEKGLAIDINTIDKEL